MWTLLLFLLLDLTVFTPALPFSTRHIDNPRSWVPRGHHRYCEVRMRCRWLIHRGKCKQIHTFIHENLTTIADFCRTPPVPCTNSPSMCSSTTGLMMSLSLTVLPAQGPDLFTATAKNKKEFTRPMRVGCKKGAPVHLDG